MLLLVSYNGLAQDNSAESTYNDTIITTQNNLYVCKVTSYDDTKLYYHFKPRNGKILERNIALSKVKYYSNKNIPRKDKELRAAINQNNSSKLIFTHKTKKVSIDQNLPLTRQLNQNTFVRVSSQEGSTTKKLKGMFYIYNNDSIAVNKEVVPINSLNYISTTKSYNWPLFLSIGAIGGLWALAEDAKDAPDGFYSNSAPGGLVALVFGTMGVVRLTKTIANKRMYKSKHWKMSVIKIE